MLQIHMGYCDACHERFFEYQQIASKVIPTMAAAAAMEGPDASPESEASWKKAERRLMSELNSTPVPMELSRSRRPPWRLALAVSAACAVGIACLFGVWFLRTNSRASSGAAPVTSNRARTESGVGATALSDIDREREIENNLQRSESLKRQVTAADQRLKQADDAVAALRKHLDDEEAARKQLSDEKNALAQQLASTQTELDTARSRLESVDSQAAEQGTQRAALEIKVQELQAALEERDAALSEKDKMLALDKDFLAHDRDIRDVMGARNLYIADIFDTTENGKTAKQFGRIFYTKDRSLIFYGFDLDSQAGRKRDVSFQVWGSGSDRPSPISLGLLYQDDSHKRWVMRCNDPKSLARLDMVFVTVEPPGGSSKPTGKQLLRAYLQIHPNHP